jgi:hypothetical protein
VADTPDGAATREERIGNFETRPAAPPTPPGRTPLWRMA